MNQTSEPTEFAIKLPYVTAKYASLFTLTFISLNIVNRIFNLESWDHMINYGVIVFMIVIAIFMLNSLMKPRKLIVEDHRLIIDGVSLTAADVSEAKMYSYYIELTNSKEKWSKRYVRFDFKGENKEKNRKQLMLWLRAHTIVIDMNE